MGQNFEEWRPIAEYEDLYEISSQGRVKSLNYKRTGQTQVLKPIMHTNGYLCINLYKDGKHKFCTIHRLVAEAFLANPENLPEVNHRDECKENNAVSNLEWCSGKDNCNHGTRNARMAAAKNKPVQQFSKDGRLIAVWSSGKEAEQSTGVHQSNICNCCNGKLRSTGGYVWRYL